MPKLRPLKFLLWLSACGLVLPLMASIHLRAWEFSPFNHRLPIRPIDRLQSAISNRQSAIPQSAEPAFDGGRAYEDLKRLVAFGPRPAGSPALADARHWIIAQLKQTGAQVEEDSFTAATPIGSVPMTNLIAKFPGQQSKVVMVTGHYDTKREERFRFVGANDGASSAALLLELARALAGRKHAFTYWLVFFDGEEAVREWTDTDSVYGSQHLVQKLSSEGELSRIQAMILVDMIGDADLDIHRESNSTPWLSDLVFAAAHRLGYGKYFLNSREAIQDDHIPFVNAGVAAVDLIDFNYGPNNAYWHTAQDTPEHCSPISLTIVGRVVLETLAAIEKSSPAR
jgi:Zn-dependent M28 family amino/carboxypeptidase